MIKSQHENALILFREQSFLCLDFMVYASKLITIKPEMTLFHTNYVVLLLTLKIV